MTFSFTFWEIITALAAGALAHFCLDRCIFAYIF